MGVASIERTHLSVICECVRVCVCMCVSISKVMQLNECGYTKVGVAP